MFSINDQPLRNLILFIRPRSEEGYTHLKPEKSDTL
jgi:hypothetical protein